MADPKRIYVRGEIYDPSKLEIFDADSSMLMDNVLRAEILVTVNSGTTAKLELLDPPVLTARGVPPAPSTTHSVTVIVVRDPREQHIENELSTVPTNAILPMLTLDESVDPMSADTVLTATLCEMVRKGKYFLPSRLQSRVNRRVVSASLVAFAKNNPIPQEAETCLMDLAKELVKDMVAARSLSKAPPRPHYRPGSLAPVQMPTHLYAPPISTVKPSDLKAPCSTKVVPKKPKATCEECYGSGFVNGFGAPCSKGCKAP